MLFIFLFLFYPFLFIVLFISSLKFLVFLSQILFFETQTFFFDSQVFLSRLPAIDSLFRVVLNFSQKYPFSFSVTDLFLALIF